MVIMQLSEDRFEPDKHLFLAHVDPFLHITADNQLQGAAAIEDGSHFYSHNWPCIWFDRLGKCSRYV